jgi:hypothetical protein
LTLHGLVIFFLVLIPLGLTASDLVDEAEAPSTLSLFWFVDVAGWLKARVVAKPALPKCTVVRE